MSKNRGLQATHCFSWLLRSTSAKKSNLRAISVQFSTILSTILILLVLLVAASAASANSPDQSTKNSELQQAIEKLTARSGPPGAHENSASSHGSLSLIQNSLWQRLRNNFEFTDLEHPTIDAQINFMQQGLQSLTSNLNRSTDILFFIVDEIDRAGLPLDIALLPLVESAFDPLAKSNQSAAGLWQFIPATADDFGLIRNQWYDGRYDLVDSTHAAILYLKRLHKSFKGDWLLALAAYNTGPGNVRHAMQRARKNGLEPEFWNLSLAKETRDYVPRLIAANKMISNPAFYGLQLPEILNRKRIDTIAVGRPLSLDLAAELAGTTKKQIRSLNTGYLQGNIPNGGPYHLTIPAETSRVLLTELNKRKLNLSATTSDESAQAVKHTPDVNTYVTAHFKATANTNTSYKPYKKYVYETHTVQSGDNLWDIALSMDTTVDTLLEWNGKSKDATKLQLGEKMIVAYLDEQSQHETKQKLINYRVTASDTLLTIADHFNVSISALKRWNPSLWQKNHLQAGQGIKIPIQTSSGF